MQCFVMRLDQGGGGSIQIGIVYYNATILIHVDKLVSRQPGTVEVLNPEQVRGEMFKLQLHSIVVNISGW